MQWTITFRSATCLARHSKAFVIVRAVVATDLLSCDAGRTLGSTGSAAWELGPKKLETV